MLHKLTLNDTINLTGSFIRLQWKHKVFNTKNVSTTFWDFFHFGTAAPWQIAKERNAVAAAWCCGTSAPVCVPTPCTGCQPLRLLSFLQPPASLTPLASPLPLLLLFLWKWGQRLCLSLRGLPVVMWKLKSNNATRKFMPGFFSHRKGASRCQI